jgi:hypothetical protein
MRLVFSIFLVSACGSEGAASCPSGQTRCGDECFDLMTSAEHCGACEADDGGVGGACAEGQACYDGTCGQDCARSATNCPDALGSSFTCEDLTAAQDHCGDCGTACTDTEVCFGGQCVTGSCPDVNRQMCSGACVDVRGNPLHCGNCNHPCQSDLPLCDNGFCSSSCVSGHTECLGHCVDLVTDLENCGACGNSCAIGEECHLSECRPL